MSDEIAELTKWPRKAEDMTVDLMLRIVGNDTQLQYLRKMRDIEGDREWFRHPLGADRAPASRPAVREGGDAMSGFRLIGITGNFAGCLTAMDNHWTALAWLFGVACASSVTAEIFERWAKSLPPSEGASR